MLEKLREDWHRFKASEPGRRFQERYDRHHAGGRKPMTFKRALRVGAGFVVVGAGLVMLVAPGPGIAAVVVGLGLIAGESLVVSRAMDWTELRLRRLYRRGRALWRRMSVPLRVGAGLVVLVAAAATAYGLFRIVLGAWS